MWKRGIKTIVARKLCKVLKQGCQAMGVVPVLLLNWESDILARIHGPNWTAGGIMEWTAPAFEEVCLNCEINSYASAKL
jgi:coenzyme PQQ precursor peptide PqqA